MKHALLIIACLVATTNVFGQTGNCDQSEAEAYLDVNNVRARVFNNGALVWRGSPRVYQVPAYSGANAIFAAGLWIAGKTEGEIRAAATTYGPWEYWPGPIDAAGNPPADCAPYDKIYRIYQRDITTYEETGEHTPDLEAWPWELGAPVIDGDGNPNNYNLAGGDRPELSGHQSLWWVMNDRGNLHERTDSAPIGLEIHATAYAAASNIKAINNTTLYQYRIIYKGNAPLEDAYIGFVADFDLGNYSDDYIGADTTLGMGYAYNADNFDEGQEGYGEAPPAIGLDIVQGPLVNIDGIDNDRDGTVDEDDERLSMTAFNDGGHIGDRDPRNAVEHHRYLQGLTITGDPYTVGGYGTNRTGIPVKIILPGDPVTGEGWSEINPAGDGSEPPLTPADRRALISSGPFTMQPGEEQVITLAIVWARGTDHLDSVTKLKEASVAVQEAFDAGFNIELPPQDPLLTPQLLAPADGATAQPLDPTLHWQDIDDTPHYEIEWTTDPAFTDPMRTEVVQASIHQLEALQSFTTYYWRMRILYAGNKGPWSETWQFTTNDLLFGDTESNIAGFMTTQNAAGPVDPPDMAAFAINASGFPVLEGTLTPEGTYPNPLQPTRGVQQSTNLAIWGIHTGGFSRSAFADDNGNSFVERSLRGGIEAIGSDDYEWRFTQSCTNNIDGDITEDDCLAWRAFNDGALVEIPFELWNIGVLADTTDDYRMIPILCEEACGAGTDSIRFDIGQDHAISDDADDPFSDWVYWYNPVDSLILPGEQGYRHFFFEDGDVGREAFARMVLIQLDGGSAPPYQVTLPEPGTTFRIVTAALHAPVPAAPLDNTILSTRSADLAWHALAGYTFQLQVDTSSDFEVPFLNLQGLTEPFFKTGNYGIDQTYYWRVRTTTQTGRPLTGWSETRSYSIPVNVDLEDEVDLPATFSLAQSYPNPFSTSTHISYTLPEATPVKLEIYDPLGRRIQVLVDAQQPAGHHQTTFDASNLSNGLYFYRLTAGNFQDTKTMTLIR